MRTYNLNLFLLSLVILAAAQDVSGIRIRVGTRWKREATIKRDVRIQASTLDVPIGKADHAPALSKVSPTSTPAPTPTIARDRDGDDGADGEEEEDSITSYCMRKCPSTSEKRKNTCAQCSSLIPKLSTDPDVDNPSNLTPTNRTVRRFIASYTKAHTQECEIDIGIVLDHGDRGDGSWDDGDEERRKRRMCLKCAPSEIKMRKTTTTKIILGGIGGGCLEKIFDANAEDSDWERVREDDDNNYEEGVAGNEGITVLPADPPPPPPPPPPQRAPSAPPETSQPPDVSGEGEEQGSAGGGGGGGEQPAAERGLFFPERETASSSSSTSSINVTPITFFVPVFSYLLSTIGILELLS